MEQEVNQAALTGTLVSEPCFSHESHGCGFYRFFLEVGRLSGTADTLPIIVPQRLLDGLCLSLGCGLRITGQIRSHNIRKDTCRHLLIFCFADTLEVVSPVPENEVFLNGVLCRLPQLRRTPLGREICDLMLAVSRSCHRSDYLPCILWGRTARQAARCSVGDTVRIWGRFQSRNYTKVLPQGNLNKTAYEISALRGEFPLSDGCGCDIMG